MLLNDLRKDYILDRWVAIASQRRMRPTDYAKRQSEERKPTICPFCPGNEHLTPPASLMYITENGKIEKTRDEDGARRKDWIIRCVPNLYPAFSPPETAMENQRDDSQFPHVHMGAYGCHEVLVESPNHDEHPSVARLQQLIHVINALKDRTAHLMRREYVRYISIFRNHGASAGASLSHAHLQIIATPIIPKIISEEADASRKFYAETGKCVFCEIINRESVSERLIWNNEDFTVFTPWAPTNPFEFWIFPKRHQSTILDLTDDEVKNFAETIRVSLGGLKRLLNDPPYNLGFHMIPEKDYHWHIEVYPKLAIWAGFEKSTWIFINTVSPEEAAESLREPFEVEEKNVKSIQH
jgi:UDPglucose--hexose-1-phosphate uridylyltransferase